MGIYLNPGNESFEEALRSKIYVDKTGLIKYTNEVLGTEQKYICVSRPRRFGKSMAARMLAAYYSSDCDSKEMFHELEIGKDISFTNHLNKYNVLFLNMQDFLSRAKEPQNMVECLQEYVIRDLKRVYGNQLNNGENHLVPILEEIYSTTRKGFVFIIDEWDCLFRLNMHDTELQTAYLDFLRAMLKDKTYVKLAYMTGILPIKKYGTHSALNMFDEYSMTNPKRLTRFVGFTEQEVKELCQQYHMDFDETKRWYDGYRFRKMKHIYSPKSVVDAMLNEEFDSYWTQTETYEALKLYIDMNYDGLKDAVILMLGGGFYPINLRTFQNDMMTFKGKDDVLTLLIHLGYLAYDEEKKSVFIPNKEVEEEFADAIEGAGWQEVMQAIIASKRLLEATWREDADTVAEVMNNMHMESTSILQYNNENALSCMVSLAYYSARNYYTLIRELPTGKGFADMVFLPRKNHLDKPAMIIELKWDESTEGAIAQIKRKQYIHALRHYEGDVLLIGINYDKKAKEHECVIEKNEWSVNKLR